MNNKNEKTAPGGRRTSAEFDWLGFAIRLAATLVLVLATYNPSGWSFVHWVQNGFSNDGLGPEHFVAGVVILIGWVILLTATQRSMGTFGLILEALLFGGIVWLLVDFGVLSIDSVTEFTWVILIILSLMLLAEGCDISVLVRCSKHCEATITRWLERAGKHSSLLHNRFFRDLVLTFVQMDELYCRVRRTGKMWLWLAIDPVTKILPALHLGHRKNEDAMALTHDLKLRLKSDCVPAFTTDGLRGYFYAITAHFGHWFRPQRARTDHWQVSDDLLYGQLVKQRKKSAFAIMRMLWGKRKDLNALLKLYGFAALIQTAFIERVNLTIRRGVAPLMRKTWSLAQNPEHLLLHVEWWRSYYHFIRPHESLSVLIPGLRKHRQRSPAQAANLTNRLWSVEEVLKLPLAPALS